MNAAVDNCRKTEVAKNKSLNFDESYNWTSQK